MQVKTYLSSWQDNQIEICTQLTRRSPEAAALAHKKSGCRTPRLGEHLPFATDYIMAPPNICSIPKCMPLLAGAMPAPDGPEAAAGSCKRQQYAAQLHRKTAILTSIHPVLCDLAIWGRKSISKGTGGQVLGPGVYARSSPGEG